MLPAIAVPTLVVHSAGNPYVVAEHGRYLAEPRWLTRTVDALPLIQTRAPSRIELKGEFAQLLPDHPQTFAFEQERDILRAIERDFKEDELQGLSFIDDFEGILAATCDALAGGRGRRDPRTCVRRNRCPSFWNGKVWARQRGTQSLPLADVHSDAGRACIHEPWTVGGCLPL
mgnify:CR=1 FL=1